jgi:uncharacterized membrane protein
MASETNDFQMNKPTVISLLYLASLLGGIPSLIGVILAYVWRKEDSTDWAESHYRYHIRTFWLGFAWAVIGVLLAIFGVGFLILLAIPLWFAVRAVKSLMAAQKNEAIENPGTWFI